MSAPLTASGDAVLPLTSAGFTIAEARRGLNSTLTGPRQRPGRKPSRPTEARANGESTVRATARARIQRGSEPRPQVQQTLALPRLLTCRQAAAYLALSYWKLREMAVEGHVRSVALPGVKRRLFDRADLDALIEAAKASA